MAYDRTSRSKNKNNTMPADSNYRDAAVEADSETTDGMTLTDFFDQMDRAAFKRSLEQRDSVASDARDASPR
jgi:hypothetical protein